MIASIGLVRLSCTIKHMPWLSPSEAAEPRLGLAEASDAVPPEAAAEADQRPVVGASSMKRGFRAEMEWTRSILFEVI